MSKPEDDINTLIRGLKLLDQASFKKQIRESQLAQALMQQLLDDIGQELNSESIVATDEESAHFDDELEHV